MRIETSTFLLFGEWSQNSTHWWNEKQAPRSQPGKALHVSARDCRDGGGGWGCPAGKSPRATEAGWGLYKDAGGRSTAQSRCPPPYQGMHLKNQPARQLSHSTFYLQRGFQGSACVPSPGGVRLPCRLAGHSGPGAGGALCPQPQREAAAQGAPGLSLSPEKRLQEAAGRGRRPRRQARGAGPQALHSAW